MGIKKSTWQGCSSVGLAGLLATVSAFSCAASSPVVGESLNQASSTPLVKLANKMLVSNKLKFQPTAQTKLAKPSISASNQALMEAQYQEQMASAVALEQYSDTAVQAEPGSGAMPAPELNFDGLTRSGFDEAPMPDAAGDVGRDHYVQVVNMAFAVWDKEGNLLVDRTPMTEFWKRLGGVCGDPNANPAPAKPWESPTTEREPIVLYDQLADRWVVTQNAYVSGKESRQCFAVSKTSDPTGDWHLYEFELNGDKWHNGAQLGVWSDGYYLSANQHNKSDNSKAGTAAVVFERDKMLYGVPARSIYFDAPLTANLLPVDLDGKRAPAAGTPNYFLSLQDDKVHGSAQDEIQVWAFKADWNNPQNSQFSQVAALATEPFDINEACGNTCIEQDSWGGDSYNALKAYQDKLMYRAAFRQFGDHQSLVVNHTVDVGEQHFGVRWYEIRNLGAGAEIFQQGSYAPDVNHRWLASMAMDASGNIGMGFAISGEEMLPSVRYTGRLNGDPLGQISLAEQVLVDAEAAQVNSFDGHYGKRSMMTIDPTDDCSFWYTQEYGADHDFESMWATRIGKFSFPNCVADPTGMLHGVVTDSVTGLPLANAEVVAGPYSTVADEEGKYQLQLPVGDYQVSARAYGHTKASQGSVSVAKDADLERNVVLTEMPQVTISGKISDGSGHGWGVPGAISQNGELIPTTPIATDAIDGSFSVVGYEGWPVAITARAPGYQPETMDLVPGSDGVSGLAFNLAVDKQVCSALGYRKIDTNTASLVNFESPDFPPQGWTVVDAAGTGIVWKTNEQWERPNNTTGEGLAASIDSDKGGRKAYDSSLLTPIMSVAELGGFTTVRFKEGFRPSGDSALDMDISVDGGEWQTLHSANASEQGTVVNVDIGEALVGGSNFRLRWRYHNANEFAWDWWAQIDDVEFGLGCSMEQGGLAVGNITDANTQEAIAQAKVWLGDTQVATNTEGQYRLFESAGNQVISATQSGYGVSNSQLTVTDNKIAVQHLSLKAGMLEVDKPELAATVRSGKQSELSLTVKNVGSRGVNYRLGELAATVEGELENPVLEAELGFGESIEKSSLGLAVPYSATIDRNTGDLWVNNVKLFGGDNKLYRYSAEGKLIGEVIDFSAMLPENALVTDLAFNSRTGMLWQAALFADNCIHEIDPNKLMVTGKRICPGVGGISGLAYDPVSGDFIAGVSNKMSISYFNEDGEVHLTKDVGIAPAGLAYNSATGHLFISTNGPADPGSEKVDQALDIYTVDSHDDFRMIGALDVPGMSNYGQTGLDIDCDGNLRLVDIEGSKMFTVSSGETGVCDHKDVTWLDVSHTSGQLSVDGEQEVTFDVDTSDLEPGVHQVQLLLQSDTPYGTQAIPLSLTVEAKVPGAVGFKATSYEVNEADGSVTLMVERLGGVDGEVSVNYRAVDGTATAGEDFTLAEGTLTWADQDAAAKEIVVAISADDKEEATESFSLVLSSDDEQVAVSDNSIANVNIVDNTSSSKGGAGLQLLLGALLAFGWRRRVNR
ncbi:carboxypeptidase regulatory-like domain-containing protein [Shewanella alkalitolerans]|uniref:Calx-beta domain-containing protein n=1 Tax=Shewanella alkalitolerans TaxID=2864209 RepID=UPI001C661E62|nr:carboxypeptidase regulatory-like domain-containing protein [Shewanella alkalitolerans]QYJ97113.1 carboxypeptidase regulatory-like domain-containing protein [Shewanella alkalitolerans]